MNVSSFFSSFAGIDDEYTDTEFNAMFGSAVQADIDQMNQSTNRHNTPPSSQIYRSPPSDDTYYSPPAHHSPPPRRRIGPYEEVSDIEFDAFFQRAVEAMQADENLDEVIVDPSTLPHRFEVITEDQLNSLLHNTEPLINRISIPTSFFGHVDPFSEVSEHEYNNIVGESPAEANQVAELMNPLMRLTMNSNEVDLEDSFSSNTHQDVTQETTSNTEVPITQTDTAAKEMRNINERLLEAQILRDTAKRAATMHILAAGYHAVSDALCKIEEANRHAHIDFITFWEIKQKEIELGLTPDVAFRDYISFVNENPEVIRSQVKAPDATTNITVVQAGYKEMQKAKFIQINGINTSEEKVRTQAQKSSEGLEGYQVTCVHVPHVSFFRSLMMCFFETRRITTQASHVVRDEIRNYLKENPNNTVFIQCHSRGGLVLANAVEMLTPEEKNQLIVLGIAPAGYIDPEHGVNAQYFGSEADVIHLLDKQRMEKLRDQLTILRPDENAKIWDHDVNSPTFAKAISDFRKQVLRHENGK